MISQQCVLHPQWHDSIYRPPLACKNIRPKTEKAALQKKEGRGRTASGKQSGLVEPTPFFLSFFIPFFCVSYMYEKKCSTVVILLLFNIGALIRIKDEESIAAPLAQHEHTRAACVFWDLGWSVSAVDARTSGSGRRGNMSVGSKFLFPSPFFLFLLSRSLGSSGAERSLVRSTQSLCILLFGRPRIPADAAKIAALQRRGDRSSGG